MTLHRIIGPVLAVAVSAVLVVLAQPLVDARAQAGPPSPNPTAETAQKRLLGKLHGACRGVQKVVTVSGFPVGLTGSCQATRGVGYDVPYDTCVYIEPEFSGSHRWESACYGWVQWRLTDWSTKGPCLKWARREKLARAGMLITAWRRGVTAYKSDGTLGTSLTPWFNCSAPETMG